MVWALAGLLAVIGTTLVMRARHHVEPDTDGDRAREGRSNPLRGMLRWLRPQPRVSVVLTSLVEDSEVSNLADQYGDYFHASELIVPLRSFLQVIRQPLGGLHGVALAKWDPPSEPSYLAVYALVDDPTRETTLPKATVAALMQAHGQLTDQLRQEHSAVSCGLWFVPTNGQDLATFGPKLPELLASPSDPLSAARLDTERIVQMHVATAA